MRSFGGGLHGAGIVLGWLENGEREGGNCGYRTVEEVFTPCSTHQELRLASRQAENHLVDLNSVNTASSS
jgi:hypothetical protein